MIPRRPDGRTGRARGDAEAQFNLGVRYSNGRGVPQDDVQAHMWFNLAASRLAGEQREIAVEGRDNVADRMTPEDRSEAQRLARESNAAHPLYRHSVSPHCSVACQLVRQSHAG